MKNDISKYEPRLLWQHFQQIMNTPHPSYHEDELRAVIYEFATRKNLDCKVDELGNVLIRKAATAGMEGLAQVVLQAHLDMVAQKNEATQFDFLRDPIQSYIDGEWLRAKDTTLGADNGIGMAAALAILEDEEAQHGDLEVLLTSNEESGMDGAMGLSADALQGRILINLDTEDENEICIGCAGGLDLTVTFAHQLARAPKQGYVARRLQLKGLKGGHSGMQINEQRGNANKLLFRFLRFTRVDILLVSVSGGTLRNAIPREAYVDLLVCESELADFEKQVERFEAMIQGEYAPVEDAISFAISEIPYPKTVIDDDSAVAMVWAIAGVHNGVYRMSNSIEGLVEMSSNLAIVQSEGEETRVEIFMRYNTDNQKVELADAIASVFELADGEVEAGGSHDGWAPRLDSPILQVVKSCYIEKYKREPMIHAVHAGLECGIIGAIYNDMDMISIGPTIVSPHSPDEAVHIPSVERFYELLKLILKSLPVK